MESNLARRALAERYNVAPDCLAVGPVWDLPEIGKRFLMFEIIDPNHRQFKSTVCYDISSLDVSKKDVGSQADLS